MPDAVAAVPGKKCRQGAIERALRSADRGRRRGLLPANRQRGFDGERMSRGEAIRVQVGHGRTGRDGARSCNAEREPMSDAQLIPGGPTGYLHPAYAASLGGFGRPWHLPNCGGWLLERPIAGSAACDATGCYPLFACRDWSALRADLQSLAPKLVSLVSWPIPSAIGPRDSCASSLTG